MPLFEEILSQVQRMPVIDTHEHLPPSETMRDGNLDVLKEYLTHYMSSDLISAGLKPKELQMAVNTEIPLMQRWELLEPFWKFCRYTGYGRSLDTAVKAIYGIDGIYRSTIEELNDAFQAANTTGHFHRVLKDLCGIELSILDAWMGQYECDKTLFLRVWQPQNYVLPLPYDLPKESMGVVPWLEKTYGITVKSLDDWMDAFRIELADALANGIVALKSTMAYHRTLRFEAVDYEVAREAFASALRRWEAEGRNSGKNIAFPREVQDYMMHFILSVADEKSLVFQFHTGLLEGNGNILPNSDPALMSNLFLAYPNVTFDLFHISYPYQGIAAALSKNFPNVFIDMCWAHIISPSACVRALDDFLDAVPYNKISGFGGDYLFVDGVYGHLAMARENISRTLAKKVERGVFSEEQAIEIALNLLYENPKRIFRLSQCLG